MKKLFCLVPCLLVLACATEKKQSGKKSYKEEIGGAIYAHLREAKNCYESGPTRNDGKVAIDFKIEPDGKVTKASIQKSTLNQPNTEDCLLKMIRGIQFPPPQSGQETQVVYPFIFKTLKNN